MKIVTDEENVEDKQDRAPGEDLASTRAVGDQDLNSIKQDYASVPET